MENTDLEIFWRNIQEDAEAIWVASNGMDDEDRGTFQKPFKTIRYAAEYVEDNFTALSPVLIRVSAGKFEEISPEGKMNIVINNVYDLFSSLVLLYNYDFIYRIFYKNEWFYIF